MRTNFILFTVIVALFTVSCNSKTDKETAEKNYPGSIVLPEECNPTDANYVADRLASYAPFKLEADISHLSDNEKEMLEIFKEVADIMDNLFWKQTLGQKDKFLSRINDQNTKDFALINYGPWDRLNNNMPYIEGIGNKPKGANYYPVDMTKEEFEAFNDPNKTSGYTLIRRDNKGNLTSVWYHEAYKSDLEKAANLLRKAASLTENESLKNYLELRAEALVTSNYQPSDFAWMEMKDANIDFVVGPIENYEDALYGYKCSFESFILVKDLEWSKKLSKFAAMLPDLQAGLPVPTDYKKEVPGTDADINVYNVIYYTGDCNAGSKTIAINLPNDEEVHLKYGSRKLQLKNSMQAKFDKIVVPIAKLLIDESQLKHVKFDAFFENTTFHEVGHAMGVKNTIDGKQTVREALKEQYSALEEGKADIMGLYLVSQLYDKGEITSGELMDNFVTFFAGIFRSCRFGTASAHGKANMMCFNYFAQNNAFTKDPISGKYKVNFNEMYTAMIDLVQRILTLQGDGNYEAVKTLIETDGIVKPDLQKDLDKIGNANIPVDIVFVK